MNQQDWEEYFEAVNGTAPTQNDIDAALAAGEFTKETVAAHAEQTVPQAAAQSAAIGSFCRNCGAPMAPGAKFCTACGATVEGVSSAQSAPAVAQMPGSMQMPLAANEAPKTSGGFTRFIMSMNKRVIATLSIADIVLFAGAIILFLSFFVVPLISLTSVGFSVDSSVSALAGSLGISIGMMSTPMIAGYVNVSSSNSQYISAITSFSGGLHWLLVLSVVTVFVSVIAVMVKGKWSSVVTLVVSVLTVLMTFASLGSMFSMANGLIQSTMGSSNTASSPLPQFGFAGFGTALFSIGSLALICASLAAFLGFLWDERRKAALPHVPPQVQQPFQAPVGVTA
jgi:hypothetical protein